MTSLQLQLKSSAHQVMTYASLSAKEFITAVKLGRGCDMDESEYNWDRDSLWFEEMMWGELLSGADNCGESYDDNSICSVGDNNGND